MKVLTVDDNYAPFTVSPENGTSPIPVVPRDAGAATGVTLNAIGTDENVAPVALDPNATVTLATVNLTTTGNAFKITYTGILTEVLGTGAPPDATFTFLLDGSGAPELDSEVAFTPVAGAPSQLIVTFGRTFWLEGQTPGAHTFVLHGDLSGPTTSTATVAAGMQFSVEDWTL